jgi:hypothetical protein
MTLVRHFLRPVHARALVTVNYGSGSPALAAAWAAQARHAEVSVMGWEVGNEPYGNGEYGGPGAAWEVDLHRDHSPAAYGRKARRFISAIHQPAPGARVGVMLVAPGTWPSGLQPPYNATVLRAVGPGLGFVSVHWYPLTAPASDTRLLSVPFVGAPGMTPRIAVMMATLRRERRRDLGYRVPVWITETNSTTYVPGNQTTSQTNALFLAESVLTWLQQGPGLVIWHTWHDGIYTGPNTAARATTNYGDFGLLSSGQALQGRHEAPANTPFPDYWAFILTRRALQPGARFWRVTDTSPALVAFALKEPTGTLTLFLINRGPVTGISVRLILPRGYRPARWTWLDGRGGFHPGRGIHPRRWWLAPYALWSITLAPSGS